MIAILKLTHDLGSKINYFFENQPFPDLISRIMLQKEGQKSSKK